MTPTDNSYKEAPYLKKARFFYRITLYSFAFSILITILGNFIRLNVSVKELLIGIPVFIAVITAPVGFTFNILSFIKREKLQAKKILYLIGNGFFLLMVVFIILIVISDISSLF